MKALIGLLAAVLTFSVSYYFAIALPAHNRATLDFEREKYRTAQQEKKSEEDEKTRIRESAKQELFSCTMLAEDAYSKVLKANGTPSVHGTYNIPTANLTVIDRQKAQAVGECQREYDRTTSAGR